MSRCVIIAGADIKDYDWVNEHLSVDDFFVYCDSGLKHLEQIKHEPNLIVGDFDSHEKPETNIETITLPCEKDDTDTFFAVKEMVARGFDSFVLVGVLGNRFDHSMANISILLMLDSKGFEAIALDDYSQMEIVSSKTGMVEDSFSYFSVINISGISEGVTIKNAKYEIENADISCDYQYGVSNEVIKGKTASIEVKNGRVLLIKVR